MGKTILVAYDGSEGADRAALTACSLAGRLDARVQLAFVARLEAAAYGMPPASMADVLGELVRYGERVLKEARAKLSALPVPLGAEVLTGDPAQVLADRAGHADVQLVVVSRSGRSAVSRLLMGSVANRLAHTCPKPLLVVP